jgi:hypothetical protein
MAMVMPPIVDVVVDVVPVRSIDTDVATANIDIAATGSSGTSRPSRPSGSIPVAGSSRSIPVTRPSGSIASAGSSRSITSATRTFRAHAGKCFWAITTTARWSWPVSIPAAGSSRSITSATGTFRAHAGKCFWATTGSCTWTGFRPSAGSCSWTRFRPTNIARPRRWPLLAGKIQEVLQVAS